MIPASALPRNTKTLNSLPQVVVTDGSNLYPALLAELWPEAAHQLCVFHVIKDINELVLDAVRRLRNAIKRRGRAGRKTKRGRKSKRAKAAARRRGPTVKEKAHLVFKHRHLVVKRRENLTAAERDDLKRMLEYLPALATLRRFADRVYRLFDTPKDFHQASCRRAALVRDPAFLAVPELAKAMERFSAEKFPELVASLRSPIGQRVRTNNHVERTNRTIRFWEKVRYKWRRRRTLVRFIVLKLDEVWGHWSPPALEAETTSESREVRRRKPQRDDGRQPRHAA